MNEKTLTPEEKRELLVWARQAIEAAVEHLKFPLPADAELTPLLRASGAAFVTLTIAGELRGCIGSLQAFRPLVEDVLDHAVDAALNDYRFLPVSSEEVPLLEIEISHLSTPQPLDYGEPAQLPSKLNPHVDGVVLRDGGRSATFLPQVWDQLPDSQQFLNQLCQKMGAPASLWRQKKLQVSIYHVDEFHE